MQQRSFRSGQPVEQVGRATSLLSIQAVRLARGGGSLLLCAALVVGLAPVARGQASTAVVQVSPLCERNGRRDYCAYTPEEDGGPGRDGAGEREVAWLVFSDHSRVRVVREEANCRSAGETRVCRAWMQAVPGWPQPREAIYLGRCVPGGYRHEFRAPGLRLAYLFLFTPVV